MKFWYKLLFLPILVLALAGCSKDDDDVINPDAPYHSLDMKAEDGKVTQLQRHTVGKGVPIIIMCDRFSDKDITNGNYREATTWAMEGLFSVHPMKLLRDYFDVYEVTAVYNPNQSTSTDGDSIVSDDFDTWRYENRVMEIIGEERFEDVTTIVLCNKDFRSYAVIGFSPSDSDFTDIPTGNSYAYVSLPFGEGPIKDYLNESNEYYRAVLLHEAIGHGFAKLADEYVEEDLKWDDYDSEKMWVLEWQEYGYFRNISLDSDVTKTYWVDFAADSRYDFEKLGCCEGGEYQEKGVYRPTENNIMSNLNFGFDVVGRAMIYKRCMKIAYGYSWEFNYEDFVKFDLEKAKAEYQANHLTYSKSKCLGAPPRFVDCVSRLKDVKTRK